jgi:hypothetical protein
VITIMLSRDWEMLCSITHELQSKSGLLASVQNVMALARATGSVMTCFMVLIYEPSHVLLSHWPARAMVWYQGAAVPGSYLYLRTQPLPVKKCGKLDPLDAARNTKARVEAIEAGLDGAIGNPQLLGNVLVFASFQ